MKEQTFTSSANIFRDVVIFAIDEANAVGLDSEEINKLKLIVEEVVTNIYKHAYRYQAQDFNVSCSTDNDGFCLIFRDNGQAFDPLKHAQLDLNPGIEGRPIGGLGIHLVRNISKRQSYERVGEANIFKVWL
ncbi:MAG: ATP-binding protein [Deltaproteobacteria bacterium]|nr:ATP-binding protein [Deltaproteobacteria bacterium]